ncbi:ATP synthase subunit I [Desulfopila sp. IMCC35006]|uniref:N-ATPase subunit AtpR n=1 Tax=Desulfopila sp. IMCC35006 TaxID=2569542 RepID=UPI0010AC770A|nr:ATP synthase subunit I [Desulfopila sp. IMCC35006]TKB27462.1 ATP synthase subunit I [Desulfopila sp. IMCC35006]
MIETFPQYAFGFFGGLILGGLYFGGLWLTVRKIPTSRAPHKLLLVSTALRLGTTLLILYIVGREYPSVFLGMLPGFFGSRYFVLRRVGVTDGRRMHAAES